MPKFAFMMIIVLFVATVGCKPDGPVKYTVSGSITMPDGKPVPAVRLVLKPIRALAMLARFDGTDQGWQVRAVA